MAKQDRVTIKYKGHEVDCFGEMHETQSIEVVCNDEWQDGIVAEGFDNWTQAVHALVDSEKFQSGIVQCESC